MNVWVALLNLEHKYGTRETVTSTLERAAQHNNPKHVYLHALDMYERSNFTAEAEELFQVSRTQRLYPEPDTLGSRSTDDLTVCLMLTTSQVMVKRFKYSKKVWMRYLQWTLRRDPAAATELLRRSLQSLAKHKHTAVISHFGQVRPPPPP